jgi:hypothetical protein
MILHLTLVAALVFGFTAASTGINGELQLFL